MTCTNWNHLGIKRSRDKEWNPIDGLHRNNCCEMSFYFNSFGLKENIDIHWTLIKIWIYESLMTCSDWNHLGIIRSSDEECFSIDALQSDNWCGMTSCFNSIGLKENTDVHWIQSKNRNIGIIVTCSNGSHLGIKRHIDKELNPIDGLQK